MGQGSRVRRTADLAGGPLDHLDVGPRDSPAVIVLDGYGSRLMGEMAAARADRAGVRVISPDRPGYWASARRPGCPLESWPTACAELLDLATRPASPTAAAQLKPETRPARADAASRWIIARIHTHAGRWSAADAVEE